MAAQEPTTTHPPTHTPALASSLEALPTHLQKVLVQELCPQPDPSSKALFTHYCTWLRKPHTGTFSPNALPTPTLPSLEALHPHKAPQPRSPTHTHLSAQKTRLQANKSSLCPEARFQSGVPSSARSPSCSTSPSTKPLEPRKFAPALGPTAHGLLS